MSWSQIMVYGTMICIQNRDQNISKNVIKRQQNVKVPSFFESEW